MGNPMDVAAKTCGGIPRVATGIPGLDFILGGGLPGGQLYVVEGDPGAGKTTLALQFLLEGKRLGERTLWCTLSETEEQLLSTAGTHGWDLGGVDLCNLTSTEEGLEREGEYSFFSPADIELGDVTKAVREAVERVRPARVVFDPFSDVKLLARDPLRYRRQVLGLREFLRGRGCTGLLVQELPRGGQIPPDNAAEGVVQGIICLHQSVPDYGGQRRRLHIHKMRGVDFKDGYHDFSIETGGLVVFPRLVAAEHVETFRPEQVSSGVRELDVLLGGGLNRGTSMLAMGPAGVGKSTLGGQFALAALGRAENVAIFLFDETRRAFLARSEGLGMEFSGFLADGRAVIHQVDPAEFTPGEFAYLVRRSVEHGGARLVVIDSLAGYLHGMPEEHHLSMHLHELLTYLGYRNVLTILTMNEHGIVGGRMHAPIDVSYLADTVLLLRYFEAAGAVRRAISAVKKRMGPHEVAIRELRIAPPGIRLGAPLTQFSGVLSGLPQYTGEANALAREFLQDEGAGLGEG